MTKSNKGVLGTVLAIILLFTGIFVAKSMIPGSLPFRDVADYGEDDFKQITKNVKDVHIYIICNSLSPLPSQINLDVFAKEAEKEIKAHIYPGITFRDGKFHEPVITKFCGDATDRNGLPALDEEGNLNFVMNIFITKFTSDHENSPIAFVSKIAFRHGFQKRPLSKFIFDSLTRVQPIEVDDLNLFSPVTSARYGWTILY
jgi:hypothetical protein